METIALSAPITLLNSEEKVRLALLHEIAHGLDNNAHGHGWIWKMKCREIGGDGRRVCSRDTVTPEGRYVATCKFCGKKFYKHRRISTIRACPCTRGMSNRFSPENALDFRLNTNVMNGELIGV
jgi:predicted SprT family Zn-dependent metalloprotease